MKEIRRNFHYHNEIYSRVSIYKIVIPPFLIEESEIEFEQKNSLERKFLGFKPYTFCKVPTLVENQYLQDYLNTIYLVLPFHYYTYQEDGYQYSYSLTELKENRYYSEFTLNHLFINQLKSYPSEIRTILNYHYLDYFKPKDFLLKIKELIAQNFPINNSSVNNLKILHEIISWIEEKEKELNELVNISNETLFVSFKNNNINSNSSIESKSSQKTNLVIIWLIEYFTNENNHINPPFGISIDSYGVSLASKYGFGEVLPDSVGRKKELAEKILQIAPKSKRDKKTKEDLKRLIETKTYFVNKKQLDYAQKVDDFIQKHFIEYF